MLRANGYTRLGWVCLLIVGAGILGFGLVAVVAPSGNQPLMRADGLASIGLGLFGVMITWVPFRRQERWAWFTLWFYPLFWAVHLFARLPPGKDHIHQVVFIVLSLAGLRCPSGNSSRGLTDRVRATVPSVPLVAVSSPSP